MGKGAGCGSALLALCGFVLLVVVVMVAFNTMGTLDTATAQTAQNVAVPADGLHMFLQVLGLVK